MSAPFWFNRDVGLAIPIVHIPLYDQSSGQRRGINVTDLIGEDNRIILENMHHEYVQQRKLYEYNKQKILSHIESCEKCNIDMSSR